MGLEAHYFYAQLAAGSQVQPWCSGRSFPAPKPTTSGERIRKLSAERFGTPADEVDEALEALVLPLSTGDDSDVRPRRKGARS